MLKIFGFFALIGRLLWKGLKALSYAISWVLVVTHLWVVALYLFVIGVLWLFGIIVLSGGIPPLFWVGFALSIALAIAFFVLGRLRSRRRRQRERERQRDAVLATIDDEE